MMTTSNISIINDSASSYTNNKRKDDRHFIKHFYHWKNVVVTIKLFLNVRIAQIRIIMVLLGSLKLAYKVILTIGHISWEIKEALFISHIQLSLKVAWSEKNALVKLAIDLYPVLLDR